MPIMCECEKPGRFHTGVPGVIAEMRNGQVAPGAEIARCDECRRFPHALAAFSALNARGLIHWNRDNDDRRRFTVHCYALVRVSFPDIVARSEKDAAAQVLDCFDWDVHGRSAEFADEFAELLVDGDQNGRFVRSRRFTPALEVIES